MNTTHQKNLETIESMIDVIDTSRKTTPVVNHAFVRKSQDSTSQSV